MKSSRGTRGGRKADPGKSCGAGDPATLKGSQSSTGLAAPNNGLLLKFELHSDPRLLCAVRGAIERLTEAVGLSAEDGRAVTRAVDEALTNIVRHAYSGRLDGQIEVVCNRVPARASAGSRDALEILLCDHGPPVNPAKLRGRPLDEVKPGGLGLHLIRQSMDTVQYRRMRGKNEFRLIKYFGSVKSAANP